MTTAPQTVDPVELRRRFGRLAAVNILSNVTVPLMGLIDTAMLGHLDSIVFLAGVALGSILFDYVYWTFGFLRMGTTGLTAQGKTECRRPAAQQAVRAHQALANLSRLRGLAPPRVCSAALSSAWNSWAILRRFQP